MGRVDDEVHMKDALIAEDSAQERRNPVQGFSCMSGKQSFRLRDACLRDVEQLVDLHFRVFDPKTHYLLLLGRPLLVSAYEWYCGAPNAFAIVAEEHEKTVGCATVNLGSYYAFFRKNWLGVAKAFVAEPKTILHPFIVQRFSSFLSSRRLSRRKAVSNRSAYLGYLVVDGRDRGRGIGGSLIRAAVESCRSRGWDQLVTCLHRTNLSALSFYQRLGFSRLPELDSGDLIGIRIKTSVAPDRFAAPGAQQRSVWLTTTGE